MLLSLLLACTSSTPSDTGAGDDTGTDSTPTWHRDIQPVVAATCTRCHHDGGIGPGDWTDYQTAAASSFALSVFVEAQQMPPPTADPTCRDYHGSSQMRLTPEQRALFTAWHEAGAPLGDADTAPEPVVEVPPLAEAEVDAVIAMPHPYTPQPDEDGNEYRCFMVDNPTNEDLYVNAYEIVPGNAAVVHHAILYNDPQAFGDRLYGDTDAQEFPCGEPVLDTGWQFLVGWAPGIPTTRFADGHALRIPRNSRSVLQMHYFVDPDEPPADTADQTEIRLKTIPRFLDPVVMLVQTIGPADFTIPAGASEHSEGFSFDNVFTLDGSPARAIVHAVTPHMHRLATRYRLWVDRGDGSGEACGVSSDRWDFDSQVVYNFKDPLAIEPGDTIHSECTWDNSAGNPEQYNDPPQDIVYGEGTTDEMCFFIGVFTFEKAE